MTRVTSVKAYKNEDGTSSMLLVGTEPSALFVSYDQGASFEIVTDFSHIEGKDKWFFPPRPYTHHVKWQASNPTATTKYICHNRSGRHAIFRRLWTKLAGKQS
jgi:hypothetical protein